VSSARPDGPGHPDGLQGDALEICRWSYWCLAGVGRGTTVAHLAELGRMIWEFMCGPVGISGRKGPIRAGRSAAYATAVQARYA
jgi:hypothetical protein